MKATAILRTVLVASFPDIRIAAGGMYSPRRPHRNSALLGACGLHPEIAYFRMVSWRLFVAADLTLARSSERRCFVVGQHSPTRLFQRFDLRDPCSSGDGSATAPQVIRRDGVIFCGPRG
jgi:hypothetical protein